MKKSVLIRLVACLIFCGGVAAAEPEDPVLSGKPVLTLKEALIRGIQKNLDIVVKQSDVEISRQNVILNKSVFDPLLDASAALSDSETPSTASSYGSDLFEEEKGEFGAGIGKRFTLGTRARAGARTVRTLNNTGTSDLKPEYRDFLTLEITQPLLKDFGFDVNTADLRVAENQQKQAKYLLMAQINDTVRSIEAIYYELIKAVRSLAFRMESRELALTLLQGNQKKFDSGVVPISEVQSAETVVASRDEQIVLARQQVEVISNQLKDLLDIRPDDPLSGVLIIPENIIQTDETLPTMETALEIALNNRPELKAQGLNVKNQDIRLLYYKNQKLPRVDLAATLGVNGLSGDYEPTVYNQPGQVSEYDGNWGDAFSSMTDMDGTTWRVGLNFLYPLGNRGNRAVYKITEEGKQQAIVRLKRFESRTETGVKNAMVNVQRSMERLSVAERFESLAAESLDQEMRRLSEGLSDTFRIVSFQASLIDAKIRKITATVDYYNGLSELYYNMGLILDRHNMTATFNSEEVRNNEK